MANPYAGEVALVVNGERRLVKLTLGALAALEARLQDGALADLVARFETGRFGADDVIDVLHAGLVATGWSGGRADLAAAEIAGGAMQAARVAAQALVLAFEVPSEPQE